MTVAHPNNVLTRILTIDMKFCFLKVKGLYRNRFPFTFRNAAKIDDENVITNTFDPVNTIFGPVLTEYVCVVIRQILGYHSLNKIEVFSKFRLVPNRTEDFCKRFMSIAAIMPRPGHPLIKIEINQQLS
ncbi:hypothetical protein DST30_11845 [Salmonella enterica subsp. enterica serovar Panama]|nr:hypothetical protein [Salmonella enterica subsp. enterica serovar Panama]